MRAETGVGPEVTLLRVMDDLLDVVRAGSLAEEDDADEEADIAHASGNERLFGGLCGAALFPVEADEKE